MDPSIGALYAIGGLLLLAAILGDSIEALSVKIPKFETRKKRLGAGVVALLIIGFGFYLSSQAKSKKVEEVVEAAPQPKQTTTGNQTQDIGGPLKVPNLAQDTSKEIIRPTKTPAELAKRLESGQAFQNVIRKKVDVAQSSTKSNSELLPVQSVVAEITETARKDLLAARDQKVRVRFQRTNLKAILERGAQNYIHYNCYRGCYDLDVYVDREYLFEHMDLRFGTHSV